MEAWYDDDETRVSFVGESGSRGLKFDNPSNRKIKACSIAGPDVGHIKEHVANLELPGGAERSAGFAARIASGGWGFPICLEKTDVSDFDIYLDPSNNASKFDLYIPINCVTADNVQDTKLNGQFKLIRDLNVNYATGRTRPNDYGYKVHFYDESTRTKCDPVKEEVVSACIFLNHQTFLLVATILS